MSGNDNNDNALEGLVEEINKRGVAGDEGKGSPEEKTSENDLFSVRNILFLTIIMLASSMLAFLIAGIAGVIIVILLFITIVMGIYSIFVFFAPRDLFFTGVEEGTAKAIIKGTPTGAKFIKAVMSCKGYEFDEDWNVVRISGKQKKSILGGIFPVGIPGIHHVYKYKFKWTSMDEIGKLDISDKTINYIYIKKDIYVEVLKGAEVGLTMVPVDIVIYITARVVNPYKALFRVEKWLEFVMNRVKVPLRDYVGEQESPRVFITSKENLGEFLLKKLDESGDLQYFEKSIGVKIEKIETPDIDMGKFQEIATAEWEAEQKGMAEIKKQTMDGDAYKAYKGRQKDADMDYISGVYGQIIGFGDKGLLIRSLEALKDTDKVITLGSIQNITDQFLGIKPNETVELLKGITGKEISEITTEDLGQALEKLKATENK